MGTSRKDLMGIEQASLTLPSSMAEKCSNQRALAASAVAAKEPSVNSTAGRGGVPRCLRLGPPVKDRRRCTTSFVEACMACAAVCWTCASVSRRIASRSSLLELRNSAIKTGRSLTSHNTELNETARTTESGRRVRHAIRPLRALRLSKKREPACMRFRSHSRLPRSRQVSGAKYSRRQGVLLTGK